MSISDGSLFMMELRNYVIIALYVLIFSHVCSERTGSPGAT